MLQQTQVATVIPFWEHWMKRFPDIDSLAQADEQEVLKEWQGLGYYRRGRMLHQGAASLVGKNLPATVKEWQRVPGVGRYTAGAIASIAQDHPAPLVDGNVERVYARLANDQSSGLTLHKNAWAWSENVLNQDRPGDWNQALMELGATICLPSNPQCLLCPLSHYCKALEAGTAPKLPTKSAKPNKVLLKHEIWVPLHENQLGTRQTPRGQWWQGMWEFPREATAQPLQAVCGPCRIEPLGRFQHTVTNHQIEVQVTIAHVKEQSESLTWRSLRETEELPMPTPQRRVLKMLQALKFSDGAAKQSPPNP
jgi:A/G-specific adenine glycosylase